MAPPALNNYPAIWFETFLSPETAAPVHRELAFIQAHLPVTRFPRVLDVACGIGRHAGPLADIGYEVVGIDRSAPALMVARSRYPDIDFRELDMFELRSVADRFDGVLCLWQSFGYGDHDENRALLADMGGVLRPGGRLLLDVYNAEAVAELPTSATESRGGRTVSTTRVRARRRLRVTLEYSDSDEHDIHDWEIFSPAELESLAAEAGLDALIRCAWFDASVPPSREHLRMQFLFERRADGQSVGASHDD